MQIANLFFRVLHRNLLLATLLVFAGQSTTLLGQFDGGNGDGFENSLLRQITLDGISNGITPLYVGGSGDGFDRQTGALTISGQSLAILFQGGPGDGFDEETGSLTLDGQALAILYGGGNGDGFDRLNGTFALSGEMLIALYSGGDGDGFDRDQTSRTLGGEPIAMLYGGGDGDGFDRLSGAFALSGDMLSILYGGGNGDGFDAKRESLGLEGTRLAQVYGGGDGDGFDVSFFAGSVPLPLTLISFDAFPKKDYVLLKWTTEEELDTDFFTIEKTRDGGFFSEVGDVTAAGFSEPGEVLHYELNDEDPLMGTSFYRLKTTDYDGAISLSHLVEVEFTQDNEWSFMLFPNPSTGRHFNLRPEGVENGAEVTAQVMDATGRLLFEERFTSSGEALRIELSSRLASGSYLIRVGNGEIGFQAKILLVGGGSR